MAYVYVPMGRVRPSRGLGDAEGVDNAGANWDTSMDAPPDTSGGGASEPAATSGGDTGSAWDWSSIITGGERAISTTLPGLFSWLNPKQPSGGSAPASAQTDYTPYVAVGLGVLAVVVLARRRGR